MTSETPAWLSAATIFAPIIASFGVLWLSNKQQSRNLKAQHDLSLKKSKITAAVSKAEELYADIQRRRRHFEIEGLRYITAFIKSQNRNSFLEKVVDEADPPNFDLVKMDLNIKAYFPELEDAYRETEKLIHKAGEIQVRMLREFDASDDEKRALNGQYVKAQGTATKGLDQLSQALADRIGQIMNLQETN